MQIFISVIINIIILAVALPLFYIYIVSRARERLERETTSKAREEIEALVKEFNNIALSRISILEDAINRANELLKKMNIDNQKNSNNSNNNIIEEKKETTNNLNIKIEDIENINKIENKKNEIQIIENKNDIKKEFTREFGSGLNRESREELRNKLDIAFKKNIYNKADKTENDKENEETNNENIIKLYKEGFSKEEISKKLNCAMTEIDIVLDMENIKK